MIDLQARIILHFLDFGTYKKKIKDKKHKKAKDCVTKMFFKALSLVLKHLKCAVFLPDEILYQLREQK